MSPPFARKLAASQLPKCASAAYRAPVRAAGRRTYCATGLVAESRPSRNTLQASRRTILGIEFSTTSAQRRSFASTSSKMTSLQEIKKNCRKVRLQSPLNEGFQPLTISSIPGRLHWTQLRRPRNRTQQPTPQATLLLPQAPLIDPPPRRRPHPPPQRRNSPLRNRARNRHRQNRQRPVRK